MSKDKKYDFSLLEVGDTFDVPAGPGGGTYGCYGYEAAMNYAKESGRVFSGRSLPDEDFVRITRMPDRRRRADANIYGFHTMEVGESVRIEGQSTCRPNNQAYIASINHGRTHDKRFSARTDGNSIVITRIDGNKRPSRRKYGFDEMRVGSYKEFPGQSTYIRGKDQAYAAALASAARTGGKFKGETIGDVLRITRIE